MLEPKVKNPFLSRKFLLAVAGMITAILNKKLGLDIPAEVMAGILTVILSYFVVEGSIDRARAKNGK